MKTLGIKRKCETLDYVTKNLPPKKKNIKEKLGKGMKKS